MSGLSKQDGTPTGGVFGFATLALEIVKRLEPDYVCVAWDKKDTSIRKRLKILPTYKAGRKSPPQDFYDQIPILHELLDAFGWPLLEVDDYEADDIMGTLALQASKEGVETLLVSSDLDMLQLVDLNTKMYAMKKGFSSIDEYSPEDFEEKVGIEVEQFLDLKALMGDSSDNIPGVPGIGQKTAIALLKEFKTLDGIYENISLVKPAWAKKLIEGKESAYKSKEVGKIWCDAPVEFDEELMDVHRMDPPRLRELLLDLEFHSLVRRLPAVMKDEEFSNGLFVRDRVEGLKELPLSELSGDFEKVVVYSHEGQFFISPDRLNVYVGSVSDMSNDCRACFSTALLIGHNLKDLMHELDKKGEALTTTKVHDISQAAFLIDPLLRDRGVDALAGMEVDISSPGEVTAAIWNIFDAQEEAFEHRPKIATIARDFDFPLIPLLFKMEKRGVKIDVDKLAKLSEELGETYQKIEQEIFQLVGHEFNIGSPAQLSNVLFVDLGLPTKGIKKGKTAYSTGQRELDKLRGLHPIIELIEQAREVSKIKGTYVDSLPKLVDGNNRLHTTLNQDVTSTGRLSSTNPNLQNIPIRSALGKRVREAFVADSGNVLVSADYSQFELRLAAILAGDQQLIDDFNADIDIHTKTASEVYGVDFHSVTAEQRRHAKVINFGVLYGMSPHGLSAATGMSFGVAKKFIDDYFQLRAPIRKFIDETIQKAHDEGYVETYYGRRRPTPDIKSSNFMVREGAKRAAANMPIQGTEADLMKRAMLQVEEKIGGLGEQILQIHDSILVECSLENQDKVAEVLKEIMESVAPELDINLRVDVHAGSNWGEL